MKRESGVKKMKSGLRKRESAVRERNYGMREWEPGESRLSINSIKKRERVLDESWGHPC